VPDDRPVPLVGDDTVEGHPGMKVHGKARHRDPVRSSHTYNAWRHGREWVVLAVLVRFPWATRAWALAVLVDVYGSEEDDRARGPHRTPARILATLPRVLLSWFRGRHFVIVGDGCTRGNSEHADLICQSLSGSVVDEAEGVGDGTSPDGQEDEEAAKGGAGEVRGVVVPQGGGRIG
jgi:hypothetical protein